MNPGHPLDFSFEDAERAQLMAWVNLSADAKIDFFEEMVELAYMSGALTPERLALRDAVPR
ncbi:hypothetical protein [Lysobacter sp. F60174L2]|uniref:hypothetical protein n=1 Tax=Lysobacter sp. F60174L2 TaxID=3459295 RepID=UPI00403D5B7F